MKFCDFCIEEHLQYKNIPRRSWNVNKIKLEDEKTGETNENRSVLGRIGNNQD